MIVGILSFSTIRKERSWRLKKPFHWTRLVPRPTKSCSDDLGRGESVPKSTVGNGSVYLILDRH